jgi:hypothetical protein
MIAKLAFVLSACGLTTLFAAQVVPSNPILFVTQVPMPDDHNANVVSNIAVSVVSATGNHLADTAHAGRGGDLWLRLRNGTLKNLTRDAGFGASGSVQHGVGIAVRDPHIHWSGDKAIFSMVVGAPTGSADTTPFFWQLYEITNLATVIADTNTPPVIVKVPNQPANYNNVMACYGTDGRIIFVCDRPHNGAAHLYPQLDEYNDIPSNTGLWSFDPDGADPAGGLVQLDHSPSGSFTPFIDSFGRLLFIRWDHLVQDANATDDRMGRATNGTFNYFTEAGVGYSLTNRPIETFPEPRTYDSNQLAITKVQGNAFNLFLPWMGNENGTSLEVLNHAGRHELLQSFRGSSFTNDPNLRQQFNLASVSRFNTNFINNLFQLGEDPRRPGTYFGTDAPDFGTHVAGALVTLFGPPGTNGERMFISYITPRNAAGVWRDALPATNGALVAAFSPGTALDSNLGTASRPLSRYAFRLVALTNSGAGMVWTNAQFLTPGLTNVAIYWSGTTLVTNIGPLWELQPVEVGVRTVPPPQSAAVNPIEATVFTDEGVPLADFQAWLRTNNLALLISRNVTARDRADREQPFNLRVPGGVQTLGTNTGKIYDISYIQFYQADQLRGLTYGTTNPVPGRRILAQPMHDPVAVAFNVPTTNGPLGATRLGLDGSQATLVPARRAMTHQTTDVLGEHVVRERYWLTYQPGEIRTCAVCHGLNVADQASRPLPTNSPAALRNLLRYWKQQIGYAKILSATPTNGAFRANITAPPQRTNLLEATTDLLQWTAVSTNLGTTNGLFWLDDPDYTSFPWRFYRVKTP